MIDTPRVSHRAPVKGRDSQWTKRRKVITAAIGVAAISFSGTAGYAYWTQTGSGTATGTTGTTVGITITGTAAGTMYPDGASHTVTLTGSNTGTAAVRIGIVTPTLFTAYTSYDGPGGAADVADVDCTALIADDLDAVPTFADFSMAPLDQGTYSLAAGASNAVLPVTGPLIFHNNTGGNQDACKNAIILVTLTSA